MSASCFSFQELTLAKQVMVIDYIGIPGPQATARNIHLNGVSPSSGLLGSVER